MAEVWQDAATPVEEPQAWELYHENSKIPRNAKLDRRPAIADGLRHQLRSIDAGRGLPLGEAGELHAQLGTAMRVEIKMRAGRLPLKSLSSLLAHARGGPTEVGAPVELLFHAVAVDELPAGLFLYDRHECSARLFRRGDLSDRLARSLLDPALVTRSAVQIVLVGAFDRASAQWGERGYRVALIAAGALARDLGLAASALGLGSVATTAFYDRDLDDLLGLDGLSASAIALVAIGAAGR